MELAVLVCTCDTDGIARMASHGYPVVDGVEYIVSWQIPEGKGQVPEALSGRGDVKVFRTATRGLSLNRNKAFEAALTHSDAGIFLIADDDLDYTAHGLRKVIESFRRHPEADFITFKYCSNSPKQGYPDQGFSFGSGYAQVPKGYYVTSFELGLRRKVAEDGMRFDEHYGIGAPVFKSGEEEIFVHTLLTNGYRGRFVPAEICTHAGDTTGQRALGKEGVMTKGALVSLLHPHTWPLRMLIHAFRQRRKDPKMGMLRYCRFFLKGRRQRLAYDNSEKNCNFAY